RRGAWGEWGSGSAHPAGAASRLRGAEGGSVHLVPDGDGRRMSTGYRGVGRGVGGGLVPSSVILLAGAPGIGKSTLLLQLASRLTGAGHPCLLASGEEARAQVAARARRLGLQGEALGYVAGRDLGSVLAAARAERPHVLIVDSIQNIRDPEADALPGGVAQVRA